MSWTHGTTPKLGNLHYLWSWWSKQREKGGIWTEESIYLTTKINCFDKDLLSRKKPEKHLTNS